MLKRQLRVVAYETAPDWCRVTVEPVPGKQWTVYSVYSPSPPSRTALEWDTPLNSFLQKEPRPRTILAGDFNLHDPQWGPQDNPHQGAWKVGALARRWGLDLLTPEGTPTWHRSKTRNRSAAATTIDLAWATPDASAMHVGPAKYSGSDHVPQLVAVQVGPRPEPTYLGLNWRLRDAKFAAAQAEWLPDPGDLRTPEDIDNYTIALTSELQRIAKAATPERRQGVPRNTWWNPKRGARFC